MTFRASTEPCLVQADLAQQGLMQDDMVQQGLVQLNSQVKSVHVTRFTLYVDFFKPENKICPQPMHQKHPKITTNK